MRRVRFPLLLPAAWLLLTAPALAQETPAEPLKPIWESPQPLVPEIISTYGAEVDYLFYLILWITLFMLVLCLALFVVFVVRYRYREGRRATFVHGNNKLEVFWTVATAAILLFLVFAQRPTWIKMKQELPEESKSFLVRVFAEQFVWHFVYPGADGAFEKNTLENIFPGQNPIGLENPEGDVYRQALVVPEDKPVILELNSLGKYDPNIEDPAKRSTLPVLHAFFAPNVRLKQDIVPFYPQKIWFRILPGKRGYYEVACAELCGLGHYTMRADFKVLSKAELQSELGYDWEARPAAFRGAEESKQGD